LVQFGRGLKGGRIYSIKVGWINFGSRGLIIFGNGLRPKIRGLGLEA